MKKRLLNIISILIFLAGLSFLLYPTVSDLWNSYHQTRAIVRYSQEVSGMDEITRKALWNSAAAYNENVVKTAPHWILSEEEMAEYESVLDVTGTGIMGYVEIPKLNCSLPIYHGTNEGILQTAVGHLEGSSLPIGGENTHCAISGHRGLPSAKLFTDLDKMEIGDVFYLHILEETLTYEVDKIITVEPYELDELNIKEGQDLCTLITCTPYGINSHRLLVRGHRIETPKEAANEVMQEMKITKSIDTKLVFIIVVIVLILLILIIWRLVKRRKKK